MDIYLPIAGMSVNALLIIALGALVGLLSGMFGVGGGFLTTPLLIFYGIPPTVGSLRPPPKSPAPASPAPTPIGSAAGSISGWAG